jgi:UDP-N-acetylmuramyl pentapeptide phosphotransferase/UDP-N-acetylglucosamine-1-phosphate transferase
MGKPLKADVETGSPGRHVGRLLATVLGVAATLVAAFTTWISGRTGDKLTIKALTQPNFGPSSDIIKTVGGLTVLIALVAVVGLVDRTGWLTRLAAVAGLVVFVLFGISGYRYYGHDLGTAVQHFQAGAWLLLAGSIVLLIAGIFGSHVVVGVPAAHSSPASPAVR